MHIGKRESLIGCLVAIAMVGGLILPAAASAGRMASVFDGNRFVIKPQTISGFDLLNERGKRVDLKIGGPGGTKKNPGRIDWKRWDRKKAVGFGVGLAPLCEATCRLGTPWDGGKVRVTAYRRHGNRFYRLKILQAPSWRETPQEGRGEYLTALVYTGKQRPGSGWFVFAFNDGWPIEVPQSK